MTRPSRGSVRRHLRWRAPHATEPYCPRCAHRLVWHPISIDPGLSDTMSALPNKACGPIFALLPRHITAAAAWQPGKNP